MFSIIQVFLGSDIMRKERLTLLAFLILSLTLFLSGCGFLAQAPNASFSADPSSGKAPLDVSFDASSSSDPDGYITSYEWDFGDGETGKYFLTSHTFESTGNYTVSLTVYDGEGASDTTSKQISVSGHKIDILEWSLKEGALSDARVKGRAENLSGKTLDYAEIKAKFYNSDDELLDSSYTNITDFGAGEIWEFEIISIADANEVDYAEVEVGNISIY